MFFKEAESVEEEKIYKIIKIIANTRGTAQRTQNTFRGQ